MILSVIIPVYKVENTLDRCVESVLRQTVPQMEVILVDDGSPDGCGKMCDEWASKDERIKVVHKANGGLSSARNAGLDIATGDYITFVDSDDYLMPDTYSKALSNRERTDWDILEYGVVHESASRVALDLQECTFNSARQYWNATKAWHHCYVWNKIFKRSLFENIRFEANRIFEDLLIMPVLLSNNPKVATTPIKGYVYSDNDESISTNHSAKPSRSLLCAEAKAAWRMRTLPIGNGFNLYYLMLCRLFDIIRFSI